MNAEVISGGCLCGAVRYAAATAPREVDHCHCEDCRRGSGAAFVTWATFSRENFRFTRGQPRVVEWAGRLRSFCGDCGTPLTFQAGLEEEEIDVTACSLDDPSAVAPASHIWVEDRLDWIRLADDLPTQTRGKT